VWRPRRRIHESVATHSLGNVVVFTAKTWEFFLHHLPRVVCFERRELL
jgi:hypothetical protein